MHIIVNNNWRNQRDRFISIQFGLEDLFRVLIISTSIISIRIEPDLVGESFSQELGFIIRFFLR